MRCCLSVLLALALCTPTGARGERATEAADKEFQAAHRLFKEGDYEEALQRYMAAYKLTPHPNVLYNLALTYERLLQYGEAIDAFERYLASFPPRQAPAGPLKVLAERTLARLRALPAQISVSAVPDRVHVSVWPQAGERATAEPRWQGRTPAVFRVPAGRYLLRYRQAGYFDEEVAIDAQVGQALLVQRQLRTRPRPLSVLSSPQARLYLDDRPLGETPYSGAIDVGIHRLRIEKRFYIPHTMPITVAPEQAPMRYRIQLQQNGRLELLAAATLAGAGVGLVALRTIKGSSVDLTADREVYQPLFAALLPAAFGAGLVLLGIEQIRASSAQMIIGNAAWGTLIGLGLGYGIDHNAASTLPHWIAVGGGVVGATAALAIDRWRHPRSGTVALYNSGASWGATLGALSWAYLLTHGLSGSFIGHLEGAQGGHGGWALLAGTAAGVGIGAALASLPALSHLSRQHVALIDLGGLIGGLGAGALGVGVSYGVNQGWQVAGRVGVLAAAGGIAAGLIGAALLTRNYRTDRALGQRLGSLRLESPSIAISPQAGGVGGELTLLRGLW